jgi:hypothetical protein
LLIFADEFFFALERLGVEKLCCIDDDCSQIIYVSFVGGRRSNFVGRHLKFFPWERTSKNLFYLECNQFEKVPQNDDSTSDQNESA